MPKVKKYNWSDAWLLLSVIYAGGIDGAAPLEKIIAAGDWINHAVFNADELENGLARLTAGNYIREKNKTFIVTLKVRRAYAKTTTPRRSVDRELTDIRELIGAVPATLEQPNANDLKYPGFSLAEFRQAVDKHLSSSK